MLKIQRIVFVLAATLATASFAFAIDVADNGGFELGDITGWTDIPAGVLTATSATANSGTFSGELFNNVEASGFVAKQANKGIGVVGPNTDITVSFSLKTDFGVAAVGNVELFSEIDGGGVSQSEELLFLTATQDWTDYSFTTTTGPDVSGGVTVQFAAITGAVTGSVSTMFIDDVVIDVVPEPSSLSLLGLSGLALLFRKRR